ncbi:MAG: hypothetical protein AAF362_20295 [Pseudomonadota bacterium]
MDRFFLGVLTGLGALFLPLLVGSLMLPGPEGTTLNIGFDRNQTSSQAQQSADPDSDAEKPDSDVASSLALQDGQTEDATAADATGWTRRDLKDFGFSVETPDAWLTLSLQDLREMDSAGSFDENAEEALILAVANAKTDADLTGMMVFLDVGKVRLDSLEFMKAMETTIVEQLPVMRLKEKARRAKFAQFDGATVMFETTPAARLIMPEMDQKFSVVELDGRAVIMTAASVPGSGSDAIITRMEQSLRLE